MNPQVMSLISVVVIAVFVNDGRAERKPEEKSAATLVVIGEVAGVETKVSKFGVDGERTDYTATVKIDDVQKGMTEKNIISIHWFQVTKTPTNPFPGEYGLGYAVKKGERVRAYLRKKDDKSSVSVYEVLYNKDAIESPPKK